MAMDGRPNSRQWELQTTGLPVNHVTLVKFLTEIQSEQVKTHPQKCAPTLALRSHCPSKVVYAANPNQGSKCIFSPHISRLSRKEGSFSIGRAY